MIPKKSHYLTVEDYTVSNKKFDLLYNETLEMLVTFPQPNAEELVGYYESAEYISHTASKKSVTDKLYHIVKKIALASKLKRINSFKTVNKHLLDVVCGTGEFYLTFKHDG